MSNAKRDRTIVGAVPIDNPSLVGAKTLHIALPDSALNLLGKDNPHVVLCITECLELECPHSVILTSPIQNVILANALMIASLCIQKMPLLVAEITGCELDELMLEGAQIAKSAAAFNDAFTEAGEIRDLAELVQRAQDHHTPAPNDTPTDTAPPVTVH